MRDGLRIFDADGHTIDAADLYDRYLEPKYRGRVKRLDVPSSPMPLYEVDGICTLQLSVDNSTEPGVQYQRWTPARMIEVFGEPARRGWDGASVGAAYEQMGVDASVIYGPGYDLWVQGIDPALAEAMARAYCLWLVDYRAASRGRVIGAAPLPIQDVKRAIAVLRWAHGELGMRAFWCRPNPINGRTLGDRYYDPLWEALVELDAALGLHGFMGSSLPSAGKDRFQRNVDLHVCEHPMELQMALLALLVEGTFERFPELRVGLLEGGSAWVPWWLRRIEEHFEIGDWYRIKHLSLKPTDYFKRNCWVTSDPDEDLLHQVIEYLGDERILFPTDYPHPDAKFPGAVDAFLELPKVSRASKSRILWDNALDYYGLDEKDLPVPAPERRTSEPAPERRT
jgi:predicted TIM-barrel fold metal-dependent hydrolase